MNTTFQEKLCGKIFSLPYLSVANVKTAVIHPINRSGLTADPILPVIGMNMTKSLSMNEKPNKRGKSWDRRKPSNHCQPR